MVDQGEAKTATVETKVGYGFSALVALALAASSLLKMSQSAEMVKNFTEVFGYPQSALMAIGVVELLVALLYAIPRTAYLGAILVTGYLGGAVATHVRMGQNFVTPLVLGILAWGGLWLRDERLRALTPLNKK